MGKFVINLSKEATFSFMVEDFIAGEEEDAKTAEVEFEATFRREFSEEKDYSFVDQLAGGKNVLKDKNGKPLGKDNSSNIMQQSHWKGMRKSLVSWDGVVDTEGNDVPFSEEAQKVLFEVVRRRDEFEDVLVFLNGETGKN